MSEPSAQLRRYALSRIASLQLWPHDETLPGEPFCLLLLLAAAVSDAREVVAFAARALRQGMVYLSVWGDAAGWVETIVDETYVGDGTVPRIPAVLVTTAHVDLGEALTFFESDVRPADESSDCTLWWLVAVGQDPAVDHALQEFARRHHLEMLDLGAATR